MTDKKDLEKVLSDEELENVSGGCGGYEYNGRKEIKFKNLQIGQRILIVGEFGNTGMKLIYGPGVITSIDQKERKLVLFQDGRNCSYKIGNNGAWHFIPYEDGDPINKF